MQFNHEENQEGFERILQNGYLGNGWNRKGLTNIKEITQLIDSTWGVTRVLIKGFGYKAAY